MLERDFTPELRGLMAAFERSASEHPRIGMPAWLARLRVGEWNSDPASVSRAARRLALPEGPLAGDAMKALVEKNDAEAWLRIASSPTSYADPDTANRYVQAMVYAASARAIHDLMGTMACNALFEVAHNAALFAHLSSTLWTYQALDARTDDPPPQTLLYWADLASEHSEPKSGGDFTLIVPLDQDRCKIAVLQAKPTKWDDTGRADVSKLACGGKIKQIDLLLKHEKCCPMVLEKERTPFFDSWCFYIFWHKPDQEGVLLPPVVRSAWDVKARAYKVRRAREPRMVLSDVESTPNGVDFITFLVWHLFDPKSGIGLICNITDLPGLLKISPSCPRSIALLNLPGANWPLDYWTNLVKNMPGYRDVTPTPPPSSPSVAPAPSI